MTRQLPHHLQVICTYCGAKVGEHCRTGNRSNYAGAWCKSLLGEYTVHESRAKSAAVLVDPKRP